MSKMSLKKDRTIDLYKEAGARAQFCKHVLNMTLTTMLNVLPAADADKMMRAVRKIEDVLSKTEDMMFKDHPEIGKEYLDVFYGAGPGIDGIFDSKSAKGDVTWEIRRRAKTFGEEAVKGFTDDISIGREAR